MKNISRWLFLMMLLGAFCLSTLIAQSQAPLSPNDINTRLAALRAAEKTIPDNQIDLSDELHRIDDELGRRRADEDNYVAANKALGEAKDSAVKLFQEIDVADCSKVGDSVPAAAKLGEVANSILKIIPGSATNPWTTIPVAGGQKVPAQQQCENLKTAIGDAGKRQALLSFIDSKLKENEASKNQLAPLIEALQKRRGELLQHASAGNPQTKVSDDLWKIIFVIGLLSVGTIVAIRAFSPAIQAQWVGSGQVIQFVTVMILLTVIMSLGLAGILKENTLGTLLGGIGGYVLSQGVGKAAAEAVQRGIAAGGAAQAAAQVAALAITTLSPDVGSAGTLVTITGTSFANGATVTFGGVQSGATKVTNTSIEVAAPAHVTGGVDVVVTNPDRQSAKAPKQFTYQ